MWQDYAIGIASIGFSYALVPQIRYGFARKEKKVTTQTASITSAGLYLSAYAFYSLGMDFSAATSLISGSLWSVLLYQSLKYPDARNRSDTLESKVETYEGPC